jgi:outer membrane lipoprotein LolB
LSRHTTVPGYSLLVAIFLMTPFILASCTTTPSVATDQAERTRLHESRSEILSRLDHWVLEGKLAINDGQDGGSGRLNWEERGAWSMMEFRGALGRGAWQLLSKQNGALLKMANGEIYRADSVNQLVFDRIGWQVPVDALSWWVRGMASPGNWDDRKLDDQGRLVALQQHGWAIEFKKYRETRDLMLPMKMTARRNEHTVKLAIRSWSFEIEDNTGE